MHISILTVGSRGDVQPFVALGKGLKSAGHQVTLSTATRFETFVREHGLDYAPMNAEYLDKFEVKFDKGLFGQKKGMAMLREVQPMMRRMLDDCWEAAKEAEVVIFHPKTLAGYSLAEKLGIPVFLAMPLPGMTPTSAFPNPILPDWHLGGGFNRMSYSVLRLANAMFAGPINSWRAERLGLPARPRFASDLRLPNGSPMPTFYPFSKHVIPAPEDYPATTHVTGFWFLEQPAWEPPNALLDFLNAGAPPVYVGFGSMTTSDPERRGKIIIDSLLKSGQRGIIATGWGGLKASDLPESIFVLDQAPHDWLFPRMAAVAHHGGAGTTAAGLRAGVPSIVCPFFGDQPFWARRVAALGVGPQPVSQKNLSVEAFAEAIRVAVTDREIQRRAADLGEKIRAEDGVANTVAIIERAKEAVARV